MTPEIAASEIEDKIVEIKKNLGDQRKKQIFVLWNQLLTINNNDGDNDYNDDN